MFSRHINTVQLKFAAVNHLFGFGPGIGAIILRIYSVNLCQQSRKADPLDKAYGPISTISGDTASLFFFGAICFSKKKIINDKLINIRNRVS